MMKVAFIGLGNMGGPMAVNLAKAKQALALELSVFDIVADNMSDAVKQGATAASSALAAIKDADVVISMLPAGQHVHRLYLDEQTGILAKLKASCLVIDCSTIDAETAVLVAERAAQTGIEMVDAPVSGGTAGALAGTLTFICGGTDNGFKRAKPFLEVMGSNIFHAGQAGAGQVAKICNNMLLSILMVGTSEALSLGIDHGLDPKVLSQIMQVSSGGNWTLDKYNPCPDVMPNVPSSNEYQGGFMVDLMVKDLGLSMAAALASNSSTPMGALARSLYTSHARQGHGKLDFSSIFEQFKDKR